MINESLEDADQLELNEAEFLRILDLEYIQNITINLMDLSSSNLVTTNQVNIDEQHRRSLTMDDIQIISAFNEEPKNGEESNLSQISEPAAFNSSSAPVVSFDIINQAMSNRELKRKIKIRKKWKRKRI